MKKLKFGKLLLTLLFIFTCIRIGTPEKVLAITASPGSMTLKVNNSAYISVSGANTGVESSSVFYYESNNTKVATVNNSGKVTAVAPGKATITATSTGGNKATCTVTVVSPATSIAISSVSPSKYCYVGDSISMTYAVTPSNTTDSVTWKSSNTSVASVMRTSGKTATLTIRGSGTAEITATTKSGKKASVTLNAINSLTISKTSAEVNVNSTLTLSTNNSSGVTWSSSNSSVAAVSSTGVVTGKGAGTATITAKRGSKSVSCTVRVTVPASSISISSVSPSQYCYVDEEVSVTYTITPVNTTESVTWTSGNPNVASIMSTSGKSASIKIRGSGTAEITATTKSGKKASVTLNAINSLTISKTSAEVNVNSTLTLSANNSSGVTWSSSNSSVAAVSSTGVVTGKGAGTATITAKRGSKSVSCTVRVTVPASSISISSVSPSQYCYVDEEVSVTYTIAPVNTTESVTWTSGNPNVASIMSTSGKSASIKIRSSGTAEITATTKSGKKASVTLNAINGFTISKTSAEVNVNSTLILSANNSSGVTWSSSNPAIASVSSTGMITGKSAGTAVITAKRGSKSVSCTVQVIVSAESIAISSVSPSKHCYVGDEVSVAYTIAPVNTTESVTWTSSNENVAAIMRTSENTAVLKIRSSGIAEITAATTKGKKASVTVNAINDLIISKENAVMNAGDTLALTVGNASGVSWSSSNSSVAAVSNTGTVTGISGGTAVITATRGEKSVSCTVQVSSNVTTQITPSTSTPTVGVPFQVTVKTSKRFSQIQLCSSDDYDPGSNYVVVDTTVSNSNMYSYTDNGDVRTWILKPYAFTTACAKTLTVRFLNDQGSFARLDSSEAHINVLSLKGLSFEKSVIHMEYSDGSILLDPVLEPRAVDKRCLTWKSSDESIAVVDQTGRVTPKVACAEVVITAEAFGCKAPCIVVIGDPNATIIEESPELLPEGVNVRKKIFDSGICRKNPGLPDISDLKALIYRGKTIQDEQTVIYNFASSLTESTTYTFKEVTLTEEEWIERIKSNHQFYELLNWVLNDTGDIPGLLADCSEKVIERLLMYRGITYNGIPGYSYSDILTIFTIVFNECATPPEYTYIFNQIKAANAGKDGKISIITEATETLVVYRETRTRTFKPF